MTKIRTTRHKWASDLFDTMSERPAFRQEFEITTDGAVSLHFHCETKHRNIVGGGQGVVGFGARVRYRKAATQAALAASPLLDIEGAVNGGNILNIVHHYGTPVFGTALAVTPAWYRFEVHMASYSSISHTSGECASINNQASPAGAFQCYNTFMTIEHPGAEFIDLTPP
jgi:hypothetical protein